MENFPQATRKNAVDDHNIKFKSMYINMDLAMHQNTNSPTARRLQNLLDPHEEFDFSMSKVSMKDEVYAPAMEVASADKLFFRGQLLPLQQDSKLINKKCTSKKCASEKGLLMMCDNDESFPMQCVSHAGHNPIKYRAHAEGFSPDCLLRDGIDLMRSCRLDGVFDLFKNDSRSSSFHSHQSSYWSSGEKDSRDSISPSRCSNGSYQDSCAFQGAERKAPHVSMLKAIHPNSNASVGLPSVENECDIGVVNANCTDPMQCRMHGKLPIPNANSRKWSWKGFFTVLRKVSKLWGDDESGDGGLRDVEKRSVFTFKELPGALGEPVSYRRSVGHDWEWQANTYRFVSNEGPSNKGRQSTSGLNLGRDDLYEEGIVYCVRSGGRQDASFNGDCVQKRDKGKVQGNSWNAKESWNRCVSKVKKGTRLSNTACKMMQQKQQCAMQSNTSNAMLMNELEDKMDVYRVMKAKSLSSTPLAKSPVRRLEYNSNGNSNGGYGGALYNMQGGANIATLSSSSSSSMKKMGKKVGFASCPASMRSSPHHSGLLAVVNKATPDLHTAIQGAIAHCKQSQASNPP